jgi:hypothetical protein
MKQQIARDVGDLALSQLLSHQYVPNVPLTLSKIQTEKITLHEENFPINEGLKEHFPTLI